MRTKNLIHPGEILDAEFLKPLGISQNQLALDLHVPAPRINAIVRGRRSITADTALRLGAYFGMEPQFWLNPPPQQGYSTTLYSTKGVRPSQPCSPHCLLRTVLGASGEALQWRNNRYCTCYK